MIVSNSVLLIFAVDLVEVCHPNNCNIGLLSYSPLGGGALSGKYLDINSDAAKKGRLNLFPGYMKRYADSIARVCMYRLHSWLHVNVMSSSICRAWRLFWSYKFQEATVKYLEVAKKHGLSLVELALAFARDRPFMTSSIIGATSVEQLKEDIDAFLTVERPLPQEVMADIEAVFKRYKDPSIM